MVNQSNRSDAAELLLASELKARYLEFGEKQIRLDLTRGKPCPDQLQLSNDLLSLPGREDYRDGEDNDCRNYGGLQGLIEVRQLFAELLGAVPEQIIAANNSSLALMHDTVVYLLLKGTPENGLPWSREEITFLCPVPGYDRHFRICETFGIKMVPVSLFDDGPDMDEVERLVAQDDSIKAIWCIPKYSNPNGAVYSNEVIERLAMMRTASPDFRIFWDNAYCVHHLTDEKVEIANILEKCKEHSHPNRPLIFASTSKITLAGAGLAFVAASDVNVKWLLDRMTARTIGPDKINHLRHLRFLKEKSSILDLMERHRAILAPKFKAVADVFEKNMLGLPEVRWTNPKGGYFVNLEVPPGCAARVISLANQIGIKLTPSGATHPYGKDDEDRTIRIAPSFPSLEEVSLAAEGVTLCVRLAILEKMQRVL